MDYYSRAKSALMVSMGKPSFAASSALRPLSSVTSLKIQSPFASRVGAYRSGSSSYLSRIAEFGKWEKEDRNYDGEASYLLYGVYIGVA